MQVAELLDIEHISCNTQSASKKRALEQLSQLLAANQASLSQNEIFDSLLSRERLGSTGLGHGVAIPHGRVKEVSKTLAAFIKLQEGIDFDASDNQPVDLLFALLVPEEATEEHLQLLAQLARMFSDDKLVEQLRASPDARSLLTAIAEWQGQQ
ncbi:MAG: PTS IIA-like nitrogen regulatory protein PtsN [Chromatiales bacterium]|nr:PTS IIA-like nitrogen regulatory protein PtsN [Chromatiales bacterium]